jgi:peptide/nickel transport system ATP-binding protein
MKTSTILDIQNLKLRFYTYEGIVEALDGVNLNIKKGEILGLVGETGCGKSVTGLSILGIVLPPGKIEEGTIRLKKTSDINTDINLLSLGESSLQKMRGEDISIIFQEPRAALNPVYTVAEQVGEVLTYHRIKELTQKAIETLQEDIAKSSGIKRSIRNMQKNILLKTLQNPKSFKIRIYKKIPILNRAFKRIKKEIKNECIKILKELGIPDPERVADMYPHELSGGMAQRVVIGIAIACNPILLVADEPTTNLDVTIQAQILELIRVLQKKLGSAVLYVTHDLGVVAELCDRVAVMYAGNVVELAGVYEIFEKPLHPYTIALLESIPRPGKEFKSIPGIVPSLINPPKGCRFHDRCAYAMDICRTTKPIFLETAKEHFVACHLYGGSK